MVVFSFLPIQDTYAQEICGNLIDDDGDCNIDCDDVQCGTSLINNSNGDPADFVVGQVDFISNVSGTSDSTFNQTYDIARDPISGKIFVSDIGNHRILRYASLDDFLYTKTAEAVLGQPDFTTNTFGNSATKFRDVTGIYVDNTGILWVTDWRNHRVLRFDNAASLSNGAPADGVLGQTDFTSNSAGTSQSKFSFPVDVVVESDGTLWLADQGNQRVLRFNNAASKPNGANADNVLGKSNFVSIGSNPTQSNIGSSQGLEIVCNTLYVSDGTNNRILWWDNPQSKANGANADGIFGQSNYSSSSSGTTQNKFFGPRILTSDFKNNLYVCDAGNHRVVVFNEANGKANNANADLVLGQPNFTSNTPVTTQSGINNPRGIAVLENANRSYLSIGDRGNHRIVVWGVLEQQTDEVTPLSGILPGTDLSGSGGLTFSVTLQPNVGTVAIDNPSTGAYTYTPSGVCPLNQDSVITFQYSVSNANGCSSIGEMAINVTNVDQCPEICGNGIDDNGDGRIDEAIPGGVGENLLLWLKADVGFSAGTWLDQGPLGNDATNFGDPTQNTNSLNFNPGINFDGDDHVEVSLPELRFDGGTHHVVIFAVYEPSTTATNIGVFGNQLTSNGTIEMYNNSIGLGFGSLGMGIAYGDSPHLVSYVIDEEDNVGGVAFSSPFYHNGGLVLSNTFNETNISQTDNTFHIGRSGSFFGSQYFLGDIQELIIYYENDGNPSITNAQREKVESYLGTKYGISVQHDYTDSQ